MITIDYKDKRPIYEQVTERFETLIIRGIIEPESKLPSVRSLAIELSINPNTIQKAYAELEREGFIYSIKGKGNYVADVDEISRHKERTVMEQARKIVLFAKDLGIGKTEFLEKITFIVEEVGL